MKLGPEEEDVNETSTALALPMFSPSAQEAIKFSENLEIVAKFCKVDESILSNRFKNLTDNLKISAVSFVEDSVEEIKIQADAIQETNGNIETMVNRRNDIRERILPDLVSTSQDTKKIRNEATSLTISINSLKSKQKSFLSDFRNLQSEIISGLLDHGLLEAEDFDPSKSTGIKDVLVESSEFASNEVKEEADEELDLTKYGTEEKLKVPEDNLPRFPTSKQRGNNDFLKLVSKLAGRQEDFGFYEVIDFDHPDWETFKDGIEASIRSKHMKSMQPRLMFGARLIDLMKSLDRDALDELYDAYHDHSRLIDKKASIAEILCRYMILSNDEYEMYLKRHRIL